MEAHFRDHSEVALKDPLLFGDYRTFMTPEAPRVYEDIQDYETAKSLFDEVRVGTLSTSKNNSPLCPFPIDPCGIQRQEDSDEVGAV